MMGELLRCVEMIYREEMWSFMLRQDQGVTVRWTGWSLSVGNQGWCPINGLTHPLVKEGKLESAPFEKNKGSFLWVLAPVALISSLIIPQFFLGNAIEAFLKNEIFVEILTSLAFDATFYVGLVTFLFVTDCVQRPYLQFSPKRLSLITGLRGYLSSAFLGFKVVIPLFTIYISWPEVGLPLVVAMAPFLAGYLAQLVFEKSLDKSWSSCWPLVPILFEVYKLYQLTKAAHYIERLMYTMKDLPTTPELLLPEAISFQTCIRELVIFGPPDFTPLFVRAGVGPRLLRLNRATFLGMHFGPL